MRARELRRQEAHVEAPELDTGSDTEVNTLECAVPPDVVKDSKPSVPDVAPKDLYDTLSISTPLPNPRRKRNSFRITTSNVNDSTSTTGLKDSNAEPLARQKFNPKDSPEIEYPPINKDYKSQSPLRSPESRLRCPEHKRTNISYPSEETVVSERLSKLKLSNPADKYSARRKFFEEPLPVKNASLNKLLGSSSNLVPSESYRKPPQVVSSTLVMPRSDYKIKSIRPSNDKSYPTKRRNNHSRDCIVM